jgi:hypothetical protein
VAGRGVIGFVPLFYVWDTLTPWHIAVWLAVPALVGIVLPLRAGRPVMWAWLPSALLVLAIVYALLAIAIGQVFGDKFTLAALWPSTALLGGLFLGLSFVGIDPARRPPVGLMLAFIAVGAVFFTFALWFLPRFSGLGLIDFPDASWGVHLYRAP